MKSSKTANALMVRNIDIVNRQIELCTKVGASGSYIRIKMDRVKDIRGELVDHIG